MNRYSLQSNEASADLINLWKENTGSAFNDYNDYYYFIQKRFSSYMNCSIIIWSKKNSSFLCSNWEQKEGYFQIILMNSINE